MVTFKEFVIIQEARNVVDMEDGLFLHRDEYRRDVMTAYHNDKMIAKLVKKRGSERYRLQFRKRRPIEVTLPEAIKYLKNSIKYENY